MTGFFLSIGDFSFWGLYDRNLTQWSPDMERDDEEIGLVVVSYRQSWGLHLLITTDCGVESES